MSLQHSTYETPSKILAREEGIRLCRLFTGRNTIPQDKQYVTLCAVQTDNPSSEINQMLTSGLISEKRQYVGIDRDTEIIALNKVTHPGARWYAGEWLNVLMCENLHPDLTYFDTESLAGRITLNLTAGTMKLISGVLLVNVMQSSRYRNPLEQDEFLEGLYARMPELDAWFPEGGIQTFDYASNSTLMRTYGFYRP